MKSIKGIWEWILRHVEVWRAAWRAEANRPQRPARLVTEMAFLPAALEIQERPPHPLARVIGGSILLFFAFAVLWACFGKVDIVAVARGKIIPSDRVKTIQPLEIGVVRAIHVKEGQAVKAGDLLVELDPTSTQADTTKLRHELQTGLAEQARINALLKAIDGTKAKNESEGIEGSEAKDGSAEGTPPKGPVPLQLKDVSPSVLARQNELMQRQYREYLAQLGAASRRIDSQKAERRANGRHLEKLQATLPLLERRVNALKTLQAQKFSPEMKYLELEQQRIEQRHEIAYLKERSRELALKIEQAQQERELYAEQFRRQLLDDLVQAEQRASAARQDLVKAERREALQELRAPVDGVVQELAVHTIGGVVRPAEMLMSIVPKDAPLVVEAWVQNKDIGFVYEKARAAIKIDTFPFTKYGTIDGTVEDLSNDAVEKDKIGLVYAARILLERSVMPVGEKVVNLTPGMTVTAEVKTGKRRIIEYLLAPLLRYKAESMQER